jgi:hypothetical protein
MSPKLQARVCKHELFSKTYIGHAGSAIRTYEGSNEHTSKQAAGPQGHTANVTARGRDNTRGQGCPKPNAAPRHFVDDDHDVASSWSSSVLRSRSGLHKVYAT